MNPLDNNNKIGQQTPMNPLVIQIAEAVRFAQTFSSPEEYMKQLQQHNPQMAQKIFELQKNVQNPMEYANRILSERGINPAQLASIFQRK